MHSEVFKHNGLATKSPGQASTWPQGERKKHDVQDTCYLCGMCVIATQLQTMWPGSGQIGWMPHDHMARRKTLWWPHLVIDIILVRWPAATWPDLRRSDPILPFQLILIFIKLHMTYVTYASMILQNTIADNVTMWPDWLTVKRAWPLPSKYETTMWTHSSSQTGLSWWGTNCWKTSKAGKKNNQVT